MILTTVCYLKRNNQTLLLHRLKKEEDINYGKWIGVGGKHEIGESPEECIRREIEEETGLIADSLTLHGFVTFPGFYHGEDAGMFVYTCTDFHGTMHECTEGYLEWIDDDKIADLPMWEGDFHFFEWMKTKAFYSAKMVYKDQSLQTYQEWIHNEKN